MAVALVIRLAGFGSGQILLITLNQGLVVFIRSNKFKRVGVRFDFFIQFFRPVKGRQGAVGN